MATVTNRSFPVGAEVVGSGVDFRVWAPRRRKVEVRLQPDGQRVRLSDEGNGYFSGFQEGASSGTRYFYRLDDEAVDYPDPASRFQPEGVHGPSQVVDPSAFRWSDQQWRGVTLPGQVIYELHIGCFTREGTWRAAEDRLRHLVDTGITVLELMPVAEFFGNFGWGYDGVQWYSPTRLYGTPDDFRRFVDAAHRLKLAVILDVVYNHLGPSGNYTGAFSEYYISKRHPTEWGEAINYDAEGAAGVREYVVSNAAYWIDEFHLDGLRIDATQAIYDDSRRHVLADLSVAARAAAGNRDIILIAENDAQDVCHVAPIDQQGFDLDGLWNDDFHHTCRVAATGHAEFYYADFLGSPQELISATKWGYLYQGQFTPRTNQHRGTSAWHLPAWRFINCLQNHDQVANSAHGSRLPQLSSPGRYRALTTLWLLAPGTPMFFMGQEFAATTPFRYFADHEVELASLVRAGRWEFLRRFPRIAGWEGATVRLPEPADLHTFESSKLDWRDRDRNQADWLLHRDLIRLRRSDRVIARQDKSILHGAVVGPESFLLRWHDPNDDDRLLLVNLGRDFAWRPATEPLVAAPAGRHWKLRFSSDDEIYGGSGTAMLDVGNWQLPGHAAILMEAVPGDPPIPGKDPATDPKIAAQ